MRRKQPHAHWPRSACGSSVFATPALDHTTFQQVRDCRMVEVYTLRHYTSTFKPLFTYTNHVFLYQKCTFSPKTLPYYYFTLTANHFMSVFIFIKQFGVNLYQVLYAVITTAVSHVPCKPPSYTSCHIRHDSFAAGVLCNDAGKYCVSISTQLAFHI